MSITLENTIEDIIDGHPEAVTYFMNLGIRCIQCGEPIWGTLENLLRNKNFSADEQIAFLHELNNFLGLNS